MNSQKEMIKHLLTLKIKPTTLIITSCSLQIAPSTIFGCNPGDLYVVRNVGGLVPPYGAGGANATISAIEYAICTLEVENVIILSHNHCDGINLLMNDKRKDSQKNMEDPMESWLSIANEARDAVREQMSDEKAEEKEIACEHEAILVSLKNLITYPWIEKRISSKKIGIYGMHFDIETGELESFNPETKNFENID